MCGISLIVNRKDNPVEESQIRKMNDLVIHRGPDDEGFYFGKNFAFGHRRLCILDLTISGHQPMSRDNYCLNYNGEIYNYLELIDELRMLGHIFKTHADTEVILPAYWQWGTKAFDRFNGMWAFMIYDATKQEIIMCRDRFGVKPLYYTITDDLFLAASEIKQFTVFKEFKPVLNREVAVNFLRHGWLNYSEETFFKEVKELKPGHYLTYDLGTHKVSIHQWYNLEKSLQHAADSFQTATVNVNRLFGDAVRLRMRADVQVGSCLSGGLDSSSIVCNIHRSHLAHEGFKTVTSCYEDKSYDEQEFSDSVTRQTGFTNIKTYPDLDALFKEGVLDSMIYHHDQPFGSASHFSEYSVFKAARENEIVVLLDGQGSDEYFCGYDDYFTVYILSLLRKGNIRKARKVMRERAALQNISVAAQWKGFLRSAGWHAFVRQVKKFFHRPDAPWLSANMRSIAKKSMRHFDAGTMQQLSLKQLISSSLPYQLHSADRNSMAFSLEVREPFLDYRLIEYVVGLPDEYKISNGFSKYLLRKSIPYLPESVKNRNHKMGFVAPDKPWLIHNKEKIASELKDAIDNTGLFSKDLLDRFDRFTKGSLGYEPIYFRAIAMNHFCKIFKMQLS